jgi:hypothetical protein
VKTPLAMIPAPILCMIVIGCGVSSAPRQNSTPAVPATPAVFKLWPHVSGRVGSYDAPTTQDLTEMAADGLSMVLSGVGNPSPMETAMVNDNVIQIDPYPWELIAEYGCADYFAGQSASCKISDSASIWILSQLQAHLAAQADNSNVVAYWFLDDYPGGDQTALLQKMHDLLVASNNAPYASFPRPAMCGFGGHVAPLVDTNITDADPLMSDFETALTNFSPRYCDLVALYPYATNYGVGPNDPSQYDWSMTYMLPAMYEDLEKRGWNPSTEPLVGVPQAFGWGNYVAPTGADITTQMTAYCEAGAVALLAYSWEDSYALANPNGSFTEPVNSADMRAGLARGLTRCLSYWPKISS